MRWHCSHCAESREKTHKAKKKKASTRKQKEILTSGFDKCCTYEYLYVNLIHATVQFYLAADAIHTSRKLFFRDGENMKFSYANGLLPLNKLRSKATVAVEKLFVQSTRVHLICWQTNQCRSRSQFKQCKASSVATISFVTYFIRRTQGLS